MLVLTRKNQEKIQIGENITITIVRIKGNTVRVGIEAPNEVRVVRGELAVFQRETATSKAPAPQLALETPTSEETANSLVGGHIAPRTGNRDAHTMTPRVADFQSATAT